MSIGGTGVLASRVSTSLGIRALTAVINTTSTRSSVGLSVGFALFRLLIVFLLVIVANQ